MNRITMWFVCAALAACSLSTCVRGANMTLDKAREPIKETRDVDVIDIMAVMNDCNETFRTEMSYVESLNTSGTFPDETDKTAKCFVRCLLEKSRVVSEDGVFDAGRAPAFFAAERAASTQEDFKDSTDACISRNETCYCERSYQFVKCVVQMEMNKHDGLKTSDY